MLQAFLLSSLITSFEVGGPEKAHAATYSLEYAAPESCPTKQELLGLLRARAERTEWMEGTGAFRFWVSLEIRSPNVVVGSLVTRLPNGRTSRRVIDGDSCLEVAEAMAVVMALTLDPHASSGEKAPVAIAPAQTSLRWTEETSAGNTHTDAGLAPTLTERREDSNVATAGAVPAETAASSRESNVGTPSLGRAEAVLSRAHDATRSPVVAPTKTKGENSSASTALQTDRTLTRPTSESRSSGNAIGQYELGVHGDLVSALAPTHRMFRIGAVASFRARSGPLITVAALVGPKQRSSDVRGIEAEMDYVGGALELGWQVFSPSPYRLDVLVAASLGRLGASAIASPRIVDPRRFDATWFAVGPGLELGLDESWGGAAVQITAPIGMMRPRFLIHSVGESTREYFTAPTLSGQVGLRLYISLTRR